MVTTSLIELFNRDLDKLVLEIELFNTSKLWETLPGITNCAGNLTLHLCGNLNHFIGATLGDTDYIRDREREFSEMDVPQASLIDQIKATKTTVEGTLSNLTEADIAAEYPIKIWDRNFKTEYFLVHLHSHLNYHLGQINYLRRILSYE